MILGVIGSGREDGNSTALVQAAVAAAAAPPAGDAATWRLAELTYRGCTGCGQCRSTAESCVLRDDLTELLALTSRCSILVLASPIYYGYASGLFKSYLDRWYSFRSADRTLRMAAGRPCLLLLTQGHPDPAAYAWTRDSLERVLKAYGFVPTVRVAAGLELAGEALRQQDLLADIRALASGMAAGAPPSE